MNLKNEKVWTVACWDLAQGYSQQAWRLAWHSGPTGHGGLTRPAQPRARNGLRWPTDTARRVAPWHGHCMRSSRGGAAGASYPAAPVARGRRREHQRRGWRHRVARMGSRTHRVATQHEGNTSGKAPTSVKKEEKGEARLDREGNHARPTSHRRRCGSSKIPMRDGGLRRRG
jgi:hypothetical protein